MNEPGKRWYESTTVLFNLAAGVLETVDALSGLNVIPASTATAVVTVGNLWLRIWKTNSPIISASEEATLLKK